nr:hypothetical protein [Tanacetum cinerariifolium]
MLVLDFEGLTLDMAKGLSTRMVMEHRDAKMAEGVFDLDAESARQICDTLIRDPMLRLCHRLIACSIAGRSHAPEKVAPGPERQPDAAAKAVEDVWRAHAKRLARLEEEVHEIRQSLDEQREVMHAMARDFSMFIVWTTSGISQLLDLSGATYTRYSKTHVPYQRCMVWQRTGDASTSATILDEDHLDP